MNYYKFVDMFYVAKEVCVADPIDFTFSLNWLYPLQMVEFIGIQCLAPKNPNAILKKRYGNWKKIPPEHERYVHFNDVQIYL
jgi:hypothetical protein